jgi:hypothetical protein
MDQQFSEGFFTHSFGKVNSMNYYFEIHSDWARGNKEMLMVSIIFDQTITTEIEKSILVLFNDFSEKLQANEEIFTAFYINDLNNFDETDKELISRNDSLMNLWLKELYWAAVEVTREKTEEEKIASLLNKKHIFKTLQKLSKGPITLEGLDEWYKENFPEKDFEEMIETLVDKQFIFINQIGRVEKYVLLLKEVNAERIPPDKVIELLLLKETETENSNKEVNVNKSDEPPELIDLLLPKVQEYFSEYETKEKQDLEEDSFTLFQIISDPKKYNILSEIREGLIRRDKLPKLVSKKTLDNLIETIHFLKECDVIEELLYNNERYIVLKTNIQITTAFPEYLRKLLPKESKPVVANKYSPRLIKQQEEIAEIFKEVRDVRDKEEIRTKEQKINKFLEDLSPGVKKNDSKE